LRFSTAWAKVAAQNVTLKVATATLAVVVIAEMFMIASLSSRDPLVIERECYSRLVPAKPLEPSQTEMKAFLLVALPMRFDSDGYVKDGFLSIEEMGAKDKEQATLKQRQMNQRIIVSDVKIDGKKITVTSDRLISIGKIKSALPLNLKISLEQTTRTEANPYGLVVTSTSQIEEKDNK
jgi:hypothetical protein